MADKKVSAQAKARNNEAVFKKVTDSMTDQDWIDLYNPNHNKANRTELANLCGFEDRGNLKNAKIKKLLHEIENGAEGLRARGVYPELTQQGKQEQLKPMLDKNAIQSAREQSRVPELEQKIIELESELAGLKGKLGRFSEFSEVIQELGGL